MTLTLNNLLSFTEVVVCIYQFSGHWLQYLLKYPLFSLFPIENLSYKILTCHKIGQGHSRVIFEQTMISMSPQSYIPSFLEIASPVLEKIHYANMSVQDTAIFHGRKNDNFRRIFSILFLFLLKTLIVGTRQNRLTEAVLPSTYNLCFGAKIRKKNIPL